MVSAQVVPPFPTCYRAWTESFNNKDPIDVIYLDYEKAFDKVPITRLLQKLEFVGNRGKLLQWIEAFLRERTFRVRIGDTVSEQRQIKSGVPQGSVLGPVLYIIFSFDLPRCLQSNVSIFADDTKIFANPLLDYDRLQADLDRIANWSKEWLIKLNAGKCTVLHIGSKNPRLSYKLNGVELVKVKTQTDLGVKIAEDLKWSDHIESVVKRANSFIYLIKKAFGTLTPEMIVKIHKTYGGGIMEQAARACGGRLIDCSGRTSRRLRLRDRSRALPGRSSRRLRLRDRSRTLPGRTSRRLRLRDRSLTLPGRSSRRLRLRDRSRTLPGRTSRRLRLRDRSLTLPGRSSRRLRLRDRSRTLPGRTSRRLRLRDRSRTLPGRTSRRLRLRDRSRTLPGRTSRRLRLRDRSRTLPGRSSRRLRTVLNIMGSVNVHFEVLRYNPLHHNKIEREKTCVFCRCKKS
ncbi:reverse transcriptase (RNA-dependent DNA polymerase) domain-containing protein [Phthorimaea operculella]|nr:reverse transcriptase (RNA-dependent DNA polymerase) domain-containing protein [Phthorimaea operculella]